LKASPGPTEPICPECNNTGWVPESEDEVTGCCEPGCPYWAEHDAKQGTWTVDLTPHPKDRLGLSEGRWRDLCEASWHGSDGTRRMLS
jgi:hypothetical protein